MAESKFKQVYDPRYGYVTVPKTQTEYTGYKPTAAVTGVNVGSNMGSVSGGGTSSFSTDYSQAYKTDLDALNKAADDYANEIIAQAQGDYDFASKWIERNYALALGSNDAQTAAFLKKVANTLEQKIGTIAFDEETNTYRTISDRDQALNRLAQDEKSLERTTQAEREAHQGSLNARGLVNAPREEAGGLYGKEVANFEANSADRFRALARNREDIGTTSERALEDITTTARRAAQGEIDTRDYQAEMAKRARDKAKALAEANASAQKATNEKYLQGVYFNA